MADNAWQTYAEQILNRFDYDVNDWAITGVNSGAAIYGHDGSLWASAGEECGDLCTRMHDLLQEDNSTQSVEVNEVACAMGAADGNR